MTVIIIHKYLFNKDTYMIENSNILHTNEIYVYVLNKIMIKLK